MRRSLGRWGQSCISEQTKATAKDPNVHKRLQDLSVELPSEEAQTSEALRVFVAKEVDKWVPIIKKAGVSVQ